MYCGLPKGIALTLQSLEKSIERRHRHLDRKEEENKENVNNIKEANNAIDSYTNTINNKDKNITHISSKNKKNNNESPVIGNMNLPLANDEKGHDNHYMRRAVSATHHRYSSSGEKNKSPNGQCCRSGLQASFYAIDAMARLQQGLPPQVSPAEIPIVESGVAGSLKANISSSSPIVVNTVVSTVSVEDQRDEFPLSVLLFGVGEDEERERMILEEFSKECYLYLQQYNHRTENIISDRERLIQMESEIQALQLENKQFRDTVDSSRRDAVVNAVSYATVQQRKDAIIDGLRNDLCQRDQSLQDLLERDKIEEEEKYKKNKIINTLKKHNKLLRIEKEDLCQKLKQLQASEAYNMQLLEEVQTNIVNLEAQHKSLIFRASGTGDTLSGVNISEHSGDPSSKAAPLPQVDELRVAEAMEAAGEWREKYLKSTKTITSLSMRIKRT